MIPDFDLRGCMKMQSDLLEMICQGVDSLSVDNFSVHFVHFESSQVFLDEVGRGVLGLRLPSLKPSLDLSHSDEALDLDDRRDNPVSHVPVGCSRYNHSDPCLDCCRSFQVCGFYVFVSNLENEVCLIFNGKFGQPSSLKECLSHFSVQVDAIFFAPFVELLLPMYLFDLIP